jgi:hypothetical protein
MCHLAAVLDEEETLLRSGKKPLVSNDFRAAQLKFNFIIFGK